MGSRRPCPHIIDRILMPLEMLSELHIIFGCIVDCVIADASLSHISFVLSSHNILCHMILVDHVFFGNMYDITLYCGYIVGTIG